MWHGDQLDEWLMQASQVLRFIEGDAEDPRPVDGTTLLVAALSLPGDLEPEPEWTIEQFIDCCVNPAPLSPGAAFHD